MNSKLLIIGSNGLLGSYFCNFLPNDMSLFTMHNNASPPVLSYDIRHPLSDLDLDWSTISRIIYCAAISKPSKCENDPHSSYSVNYKAPLDATRFANHHDIPITLFSSEYVFDGLSDTPYLETSAKTPTTVYGFHKAKLEDDLQSSELNYLCFRISKLASFSHPLSFLSKMITDLRSGQYNAAVDQFF